MKRSSRKQNSFGYHGQAIVEFAIALPILMALLVGILEVGRMIFIYSAVTNASREAVRYASAVGLDDSGNYNKYQYCDGIRSIARRSAYFLTLADSDIAIAYDNGPGQTPFDTCSGSVDTGVVVNLGTEPDRVVVEVTANYSPMLNLLPIGPRTIISESARTFLGIFNMTTGQSSVPGGGGPGPGPTRTPTNTPTDTPTNTPTDTPTATEPAGEVITFTPLPTNTPSNTPTITPTFTPSNTPTMTLTPSPTFTPTSTPTPMPGCDSITRGAFTKSGNNLSMTITNPHDAITVQNIQVTWNHDAGGQGSKPALTLQYVMLGSQSWTVTEIGPSATITPSPTMIIPGNNVTSTITFLFNKGYHNLDGTEAIVIKLSTPGCETFPIQRP